MAKWPGARWESGAPCSGTLHPIAVCLHHQAGNGDPLGVYISRRVSAHFWLPYNGQPIQHVDTSVQAWHGVQHNAYSIGVETEGCGSPPNADPLNENQLNQFAALMKWANATHGIPLVLSEAVTTPGFNYHRCQGGPATGCPCDVRKNARAEILKRTGSAPVSPTPTPPPTGSAPPFPGTLLVNFTSGHGTQTWQGKMAQRGWTITVDDLYGDQSAQVCIQFQMEKGLGIDGIVGLETWNATWNAPIT